MNGKIAVIEGDGIGPEVVEQAVRVLDAIALKFGHTFDYQYVEAGGCAIDSQGKALPKETLDVCKASDAVLLGAVGGPKWDTLPGSERPEQALLGLRSGLGLFANLRPVQLFKELADNCPLKKEIIGEELDIMIVRELTGGIYFGNRKTEERNGVMTADDTMTYSVPEIDRVVRVAMKIAQGRDKKLTSVDKANILDTSRLWRSTVESIAKEYPDIQLDHLYVDNTAMQLVRNPKQFDVIVTGNMFGDILSDEGAMLTGSIGMLPSASLGEGTMGMYEPVHGSAPDIAGKGLANPIATIMSIAMLLRHSFNLFDEAKAIEDAVSNILAKGLRTGDIAAKGDAISSTAEIGDAIVAEI
jgi:3-isopropylmalate dehydrogenase